jgi:hypothetical protein
VAKCHYHDTVTDILAMAPLLAGLKVQVFGGIALNSQNGGLNPFAVDQIIGQARAAGALISTGHLGPEPAKALVEAAVAAGHDRIVVSDPNFVVAMERPQAIELAGNALPIEAYRQVVGDLPDSGVAERDIRLMIRDNPARLIGLD